VRSRGTAFWTSTSPSAATGRRTNARARRPNAKPYWRTASGWGAGAFCAHLTSSAAPNPAEDATVDLGDSSDEDGESGSTSSPSSRNTGYQSRPGGIKAAKQMLLEDAGMEKQVEASTAAVNKLTVAQQ